MSIFLFFFFFFSFWQRSEELPPSFAPLRHSTMATHVLLHPVLSPAADRAKKRKEINEPTFSFLSIRNKKKKNRKTWLSKITKRKLLFTLVCKAETRKLKNVHKITRFCAYRCLYYVITAASASHETPSKKKKKNKRKTALEFLREAHSIHPSPGQRGLPLLPFSQADLGLLFSTHFFLFCASPFKNNDPPYLPLFWMDGWMDEEKNPPLWGQTYSS